MSGSYRKKLIEVALPLDAINREAAREKSIRHGHPSTLHLWWARRPLAACRAVLFASLIDDPEQEGVPRALLDRIDRLPLPEDRGPDWHELPLGEQRRKRLFSFIDRLVRWENSTNENLLSAARELIQAATAGNPPPVLDPFCGGGSIPLEAQRLGLEAHASDLNPVAVLITKALVEIPPKFANCPPVNPEDRKRGLGAGWKGASGLAADVRYYGKWIRDEAEKRIGDLYPKVQLPKEQGGGEATVIAWLWARTVTCPNPACGAQMPLVQSFELSKKPGRQAWLEPLVNRETRTLTFEVRTGEPTELETLRASAGTALTNERGKKTKGSFFCAVCGSAPVTGQYIDEQANTVGLGIMPLALVAEGSRKRVYLRCDEDQVAAALRARRLLSESGTTEKVPREPCRGTFASNAQGRVYGFRTFSDYFTPRQLMALTTFGDLVGEAREHVRRDISAASLAGNSPSVLEGDLAATDYASAVATYLGLAVSRSADFWCTLATWSPQPKNELVAHAFSRQAIPMTWDFAEVNPFSSSGGNYEGNLGFVAKVLENLPTMIHPGCVRQVDVTVESESAGHALIATDPPYYDNIRYADLSDFFYVWLKKSLNGDNPELFSTLLTPKTDELVATPYRFGGDKNAARRFFEERLERAFARMREAQHPTYPLTVYYAFKQAEVDDDREGPGQVDTAFASTGWETMLEALLKAGFRVTGTWPVRTERGARSVGIRTNALASSIVLVCRPRPTDAGVATRREFTDALRNELPDALRQLQHGNVPPVDLSQAAIGPGMAVFSRYSKVVDASGHRLSVRTALQLINQVLDQVLTEQEAEFDPATRWAITWFEQRSMSEGPFGEADVLARAKNTAVQGLVDARVVEARAGKVRLLGRDMLPADWDPATDRRLTIWESTQHLIRALDREGEAGAARLLARLGGLSEIVRDLAYRLYVTCERKGWAQEAMAYNGLVVAWPEIARLASEATPEPIQARLLS